MNDVLVTEPEDGELRYIGSLLLDCVVCVWVVGSEDWELGGGWSGSCSSSSSSGSSGGSSSGGSSGGGSSGGGSPQLFSLSHPPYLKNTVPHRSIFFEL